MDRGVKHFVGKILAIHLVLLVLLLAIVALAAKHVYQSARNQAMEQARIRQTLLADQTANGIQEFYKSILGDLRLLKPEETRDTDLPDQPVSPLEPRQVNVLGPVGRALGKQLASQLNGRAYLFLVDEQLHPHTLGADEKALKFVIETHGGRKVIHPATAPSMPFEDQLLERFRPWLKQVDQPAISKLELVDKWAIKLVAIPLTGIPKNILGNPNPVPTKIGWLVAAVSAHNIEEKFLANLSEQHKISGAVLVDESMTIMAAADHDLVGTKLNSESAPELAPILASLATRADNATINISEPFHIGAEQYEPSMLNAASAAVRIAEGDERNKQAGTVKEYPWFVLISLPLKEVDGGVRDLLNKALWGATIVAVAMAGILVSTATQLILTRLRMERSRHQTLQNEMRQARQIQLAWLPQKTKTTSSDLMLDIASLNRPATHISGDFYNFFELPDGRTAIVIGDVTGHGMAAAFLMATTQLLIRNTLPQHCDPGRTLEIVNQQLTNQVFNGQFVTMQILVIEPASGEVLIATAGHPAPLLCHGDQLEALTLESQLVAGLDPDMKYPTERFNIRPGTSILLYTDGVVETENPSGEMLRLDGLKHALSGAVDSAEVLLQKAVSAVNTHRRGEDLHDDLTMVAVRLLPRSASAPRDVMSPVTMAEESATQLQS